VRGFVGIPEQRQLHVNFQVWHGPKNPYPCVTKRKRVRERDWEGIRRGEREGRQGTENRNPVRWIADIRVAIT
jgi:hypothetical protein